MIIVCQVDIILKNLEDYWGMLSQVRAANLNTEEIANILNSNENMHFMYIKKNHIFSMLADLSPTQWKTFLEKLEPGEDEINENERS